MDLLLFKNFRQKHRNLAATERARQAACVNSLATHYSRTEKAEKTAHCFEPEKKNQLQLEHVFDSQDGGQPSTRTSGRPNQTDERLGSSSRKPTTPPTPLQLERELGAGRFEGNA